MVSRLLSTIAGAFALCTAGVAAAQVPAFVPFAFRVLAAHNVERARMGIAPLAWDPALAAAADRYAADLARSGGWGHSDGASRPDQGENLWMGTHGAFPAEAMVGAWLSEKSTFRPAVFPAVSSTGRWYDVGHYTQMISRRSTRVGCALHSGQSDDYLVCRYWPAGNVIGMRVP